MRVVLMVGACLGLAACQETMGEEKPTEVAGTAEDCGAEQMSHLMGLSRAQLETIAFTQPYRILGPNDAMTMDFRGDRVNFALDGNGVVDRIFCG